MFSQKLKNLMDAIGATSADIAGYAHFDRTNISRLLSGKRQLKVDSITVVRLCEGIYLYAHETDHLSELCRQIGFEDDMSPNIIKNHLAEWLFVDTPRQKTVRNQKKQKPNTFGKHLDQMMTLLELSNVRCSQLLYVDSSLISRYRKGTRTPKPESDTAKRLCAILWKRAEQMEKQLELGELLSVPASEIDEGCIHSWLFETDNQNENELCSARQFLKAFDGYTQPVPAGMSGLYDIVPVHILDDKQSIYHNKDGLRTAVLRFLSTALKDHAKELFLYSDQEMSWMTEDRLFFRQWAGLMSAVVQSGTKITIIHNVERSMKELSDAIIGWLPLYMSGKIESYYCRKPQDVYFSHTLFLNPGTACIHSSHVLGSEQSGRYRYYTEPEDLAYFQKEYKQLRKFAKPLVSITSGIIDVPYQDLVIIRNGLSAATMTEELALSFHNASFYDHWKEQHHKFMERLSGGKVTECVSLADPELVSSGKVCAGRSADGKDLFYTPEQYAMHVQSVLSLAEQYPQYQLILMEESDFENVSIILSENLAQVVHAERPHAVFNISHPAIIEAFTAYANHLTETNWSEQNSMIKMLREKYQRLI